MYTYFNKTAYIPKILVKSMISVNPNILITTLIDFMFVLVGFIFFITVLISGVEWMISGSDSKKNESAKKRLINSIIGIFIIGGSYLILEVLGGILGFNNFFNKTLFTNKCNNTTYQNHICLG